MRSALTHRPLCGKEAQNGSPAAVSWYSILSSCAPPSSCFRFKSKKRIKSPGEPDFLCERAILFCYLKRTPRILARIAREHRLRCFRALRVHICFYIQDSTIFLLCQEGKIPPLCKRASVSDRDPIGSLFLYYENHA